jgi:hypothetical protein
MFRSYVREELDLSQIPSRPENDHFAAGVMSVGIGSGKCWPAVGVSHVVAIRGVGLALVFALDAVAAGHQ